MEKEEEINENVTSSVNGNQESEIYNENDITKIFKYSCDQS